MGIDEYVLAIVEMFTFLHVRGLQFHTFVRVSFVLRISDWG
jgi:hypothetical protein